MNDNESKKDREKELGTGEAPGQGFWRTLCFLLIIQGKYIYVYIYTIITGYGMR